MEVSIPSIKTVFLIAPLEGLCRIAGSVCVEPQASIQRTQVTNSMPEMALDASVPITQTYNTVVDLTLLAARNLE